ncbi:MAG: radical SAM protein [Bacteroidota bacterium]
MRNFTKTDTSPYNGLIPHTLKVYPIVQVSPNIGPMPQDKWPLQEKKSFISWKEKTGGSSNCNIFYVHIPFCPFLCHFCPLYKVKKNKYRTNDYKAVFVDHLIQEIEFYGQCAATKDQEYSAIYFGGGTPTELTPEQLILILNTIKNNFKISSNAEITLEGVAKQMLQENYLAKCFEGGFNRISFGVQSIDEGLRKAIGRGDKVEDYTGVISLCRNEFPWVTVNIDLMACLPGQSFEILKNDIETVISWNLDSIDVLYFTMTVDTKLNKFVQAGKRAAPVYGRSLAKARGYINNKMLKSGYKQVTGEVFVKVDDNRFVENSFGGVGNRLNTVLAVGPSSFGLIGGTSYQNTSNFEEYLQNIDDKLFPITRAESLNARKAKIRAQVLSVLQLYIPKFLMDSASDQRLIRSWHKKNLIVEEEQVYRLTTEGKKWFNLMQMDFLQLSDKINMLRFFGDARALDKLMEDEEKGELLSHEKELLKVIFSQNKPRKKMERFLFKSYLKLRKLPFFETESVGFAGVVNS